MASDRLSVSARREQLYKGRVTELYTLLDLMQVSQSEVTFNLLDSPSDLPEDEANTLQVPHRFDRLKRGVPYNHALATLIIYLCMDYSNVHTYNFDHSVQQKAGD